MRTGGGFVRVDDFIRKAAREQCLKLKSTMKKKNLTYKKAVAHFVGV
jgi:maltooligosyltrehalose synthase